MLRHSHQFDATLALVGLLGQLASTVLPKTDIVETQREVALACG